MKMNNKKAAVKCKRYSKSDIKDKR
ncbi:unknown protein [Waddlia chondrophila 2032/99]|uniref:Uncharacterized protein n=1 Tax=Waddlia chondrophila 2032/99 TaxID=765953 RepID=F8LDB7_9BACT|nr:unknown protein [Waddlia chondrophila 2032/99]